jgi:hypothetical protein
MGSFQRPLQPGMVLRFESLEFMSHDGSYDMELLPSQHNNNDGHRLVRQGRTRRWLPPAAEEEHPGLPRHPPRQRRRRRGNRGQAGGGTSSAVGPERVDDAGTPAGDMSGVVLAPETTAGVASQQRANPKRTDDASTLTRDLLDVSLVPKITVHSVPDATSPPSANQQVPSVFHLVPFRFSFDPPSDPASVSAFVRAYPNLSGCHMWSTWDRLTAVSTSRPAGSEEEDDPDVSWDFSRLRDPGAMRDFMSACDHCLSGCSDDGHNLDDEGCDPTRECYHIDQENHDGENHLGMPGSDGALAPTSRVEIPRELAVVQVPAGGQDTQLEQLHEMQPSSTKKQGSLCSSDKTSSRSGQAGHSLEERIIGAFLVGTTLPRLGEQTRTQDSHQGERIDGHRHQVRLWSGGGRSHLSKGQAASGRAEGRRPRGDRPAWREEEGQEEGTSKMRRR